MDIVSCFETFAAVVALIPVVTEGIKSLIKKELPSWANQLISWIVALLIALFGQFFNLGVFADVNWWQSLIIGIFAGLASNGIWDINIVQQLLKLIFEKIKISSSDSK